MLVTVILFTIGIFFIMFGILFETKEIKGSIVFKVLPFLSGLYLVLSQFNSAYLYFPIVAGSIGLYFVCFALVMKVPINTGDIYMKILINYLPFISGVFLVINGLRDLNLL